MAAVYGIVDSSTWPVIRAEPAGGNESVWLEDVDGQRWLFKPRTEHAGWTQGEDWAEKLGSEVAGLLGVPAARVELTRRGQRLGTVSGNVLSPGDELQHGELLIAQHVERYEGRTKERLGHDVATIREVLRGVAAPRPAATATAFDAFAGYLLLDALIANQDRHEQNWAVVRPVGGTSLRLAPSYLGPGGR